MYVSANNEYPRFIGDLLLEHPNFSEGDTLPDGWVKVEEAPTPDISASELFYEGALVEVDGVMTQNWLVRDLTDEELANKNAPTTARAKLLELGLTDAEVSALVQGMVR